MPYCYICSKDIFSQQGLKQHIQSHRYCPQCSQPLPTLDSIEPHVFQYHPKWARKNLPKSDDIILNLDNLSISPNRNSPCVCGVDHMKLLDVYRRKDQYMYKCVFKCTQCGRFPITVPLAADKEYAKNN
ncbi:hypothetical protein BC833DRAFT_569472 [Globomyces pollinis-pini]|nr:hypothetical protein BC833DRAFT_569472 [Globomyces pollinis-pini]